MIRLVRWLMDRLIFALGVALMILAQIGYDDEEY